MPGVVGVLLWKQIYQPNYGLLNKVFKEVLFFLVVFLFLVPSSLTLTPRFVLFDQLHLRNALAGLIVSYIKGGRYLRYCKH